MKKIRVTARITEVSNLATVIVRLFKAEIDANSDIGNDAFLIDAFAQLEKLSTNLISAIKTDKILSNLDVADSERDELFRQLNAAVTGYANLPFPDYQQAAATLLSILDKYKRLPSENYASESALIKSLLEDLSAPNAKSAISLLYGIDELIRLLTYAQEKFDQTNDAYNAAAANKTDSATNLKKTACSLINDRLIPYLSAMRIAKPAFSDFCAKLENEVNRANLTVTKRQNQRSDTPASQPSDTPIDA